MASTKASNTGAGQPRKRKVTGIADIPDVSTVLSVVRQLREDMKDREGTSSSDSLSSQILDGVTEVQDLPSEEVSNKIEDVIVSIVAQIVSGNSFELSMPNRASSNQKYIEELDRIVLGDKVSKRQFLNTAHVRKTAITTRVLELVHEVLSKGIHITKRDLFYTDVKLFKDQSESDAVLDDVACMVGCTRTSLHVVRKIQM